MIYAVIDRPLGSRHPDYPDLVYTLNYGYAPGILGGDGEEQDVYIYGIDTPLSDFSGELVAVIHREDDDEYKWVLAPSGLCPTAEEIASAVEFQERYFVSRVELIDK